MRFLSADVVFPITRKPLDNGILAVSANGTIMDVMLSDDENAPDVGRIEKFKGILCPGFVNAHCHLELSHMKGVVPEHTGLPDFLTDIVSKRGLNEEIKAECIKAADKEMWTNGIQAVGDICNTADTIDTKLNSKVSYHSFVEVFAFDPNRSEDAMRTGIEVASAYQKNGLPATIVPHAPYSVSSQLHALIRKQQENFSGAISIHNQETPSEDELFISATGALKQTFENFGMDFSHFKPTGKTSLRNALPELSTDENVLLIHNTETQKEDMEWATSQAPNLYWCTCPHANKYIENKIADVRLWLAEGLNVCVGTDSLASNHQLSILDELKLMQKQFPKLDVNYLLKMATITGAKALNMDKKLGSFEKSKLPGIILLKNVDCQKPKLNKAVSVQRII